MAVDKEAIEPILLKHIIEAQRKSLREDISEEQRKFNARWYLINSTDSYIGLINGINEIVDEYAASLRKENEELRERFEKSFKLAEIRRKEIDKLILEQGELQSSNEAKEKRIEELTEALNNTEKAYEIMRDKSEYWKQRCEAAEAALLEYISNPTDEKVQELLTLIEKWQALKNKTQ